MSAHFALSLGVAASVLPLALPGTALAMQGFMRRSTDPQGYVIAATRDRLTDTTQVTATLSAPSRPFGLGSRAWLDLSFGFTGPRLTARPTAVRLTVESWTPARGGWAFAHSAPLEIRGGDSLRLELPAEGYLKRPVGLFDTGRREALWFAIPSADYARVARLPEVVFSVGRARFRVRERMEMLREVLRRMTPLARGPQ